MNRDEKFEACRNFFERLAFALSGGYEVVGSCNVDNSVYLVPCGRSDQITYYGKPDNSFRLSDHWNWYTSEKKCDKKNYIQCYSTDMPRPNSRPLPWKASKPKYGCQVAIYGKDHKYHCVYGEIFDRKTKQWNWIENDIDKVVRMVTES